jgi:CIC family chloride channel protein
VLDASDRLLGMIPADDLRLPTEAEDGERRLVDMVREPAAHVHPDHPLDTVLVKLGRLGVEELPVVSRRDPRRLLGVISMGEVAAAMAKAVETGPS